ncbi:glycosyltransferase family A protein [Flavobacterium luminosum]|uniref:Glycosyltransferase family 2 protein n=1 Tax=Flavobacterium luminosum TaxID=2949086 RepID=A0ABT0TNL4_9FLAO|nr:glycosyltransferase family A protein [Flavobacterium sp. HXWNR70]MCL9809092.1 glycosyltransferase family 2 protein [Flavobacterium sp. HXWNR70]
MKSFEVFIFNHSSMNLKSDVTVVIPCYNDGKYIKQALYSVINQTVPPDKIIIIDDGSRVETKIVLESLKHPLLEIIYQENQGVSVARNNAIKKANTTYILNLDADDYYEPTFIEKALLVINRDAQVGVVSSFCRTFNHKGETIEIIEPLGGVTKDFIVKNNGRASALFRKKCWEQVSGYDEKMLNGYEDWEFWIAILKNHWRMEIIPEVLSHYRIKKTSRDKTAFQKHDFELRKYIFEKHKEVYLEHLDFYLIEMLRINSVLKNNVHKFKNSLEYKIGKAVLYPLRMIKKIIEWRF